MAKNKVLIKKKYQNCFFLENSRFFLKSSYFFGYNIEKKGGIQVFLGNLNFSFLSAGR